MDWLRTLLDNPTLYADLLLSLAIGTAVVALAMVLGRFLSRMVWVGSTSEDDPPQLDAPANKADAPPITVAEEPGDSPADEAHISTETAAVQHEVVPVEEDDADHSVAATAEPESVSAHATAMTNDVSTLRIGRLRPRPAMGKRSTRLFS